MSAEKKIIIIAGPNGAGKTRVAKRAQRGGHDIPENVIRRRFAAGMRNFLEIYRDRVDHWQWIDNSGPEARLIAEAWKS